MPASPSNTVAFAVRGPIARSDLDGLCDRVCAVLRESHAEVAFCDVAGLEPPPAGDVGAPDVAFMGLGVGQAA